MTLTEELKDFILWAYSENEVPPNAINVNDAEHLALHLKICGGELFRRIYVHYSIKQIQSLIREILCQIIQDRDDCNKQYCYTHLALDKSIINVDDSLN